MNFKVWFLAFGFSLFALSASPANTIPTAEDINSLAETARLTTDTFMRESFQLRMRYEFSGQFLNRKDEENLQKLAKKAGNRLQAIAESQQKIKKQIEDYQGDDWDNRYGSTGLWRKLSRDLYITTLSKCEIDLYLALSSQQLQRNKISQEILAQIDSLNQIHNIAYSQFLKARTLTLLARTDPVYKPLAKKEFDALMIRSDMRQSTAFRIAIERIKLLGQAKPAELEKLTRELAQSSCAKDLELVLSLAFLQRRHDAEAFEKIVQLQPQIKSFLRSLILQNLSCQIKAGKFTQQTLEQITVFEAELVVQQIWNNISEEHQILLDHLTGTETFQTPLILYVAAIASADSSPTKAVKLLVKASKLQQQQKSEMLETSAEEIAKQAAKLAYNLFGQNSPNCPAVLEAFENYSTITNEKIDEELEYIYSIVLNDCGKTTKSKELLQKIANRPAGNWRNRAKLDLIVQAIEQEQQSSELLEQLRKLILTCNGQDKKNNKLRMEAITIYCQSLLELKNEVAAQSVLTVLAEAETTPGINLNLFKAQALQQLRRLDESAHYMLLAIQDDSGSLAGEVMELLSEVVDTIDELELQADDFDKTIYDCKKLAEFSHKSTNGRQSGLLITEISILAADKDKKKLSEAENLLNNIVGDGDANDINLLRCRARLLDEQGKFSEAARLWAQVAKIRKSETVPTNQRSWKWWRAKFYELYCCAKISEIEKEQVSHTIEVLENSFADIPPLWAEKLSSLKQQCHDSKKQKTQNVKI
ncbi:MAG: hypothetical protein ACYS6W_04780 [Planctomycetota bacterium]